MLGEWRHSMKEYIKLERRGTKGYFEQYDTQNLRLRPTQIQLGDSEVKNDLGVRLKLKSKYVKYSL